MTGRATTPAAEKQPRGTFSFAVQAAPARHSNDWVGLAQQAEELGYRALLVPGHIGSGGPLAAMALAGASTESLHVGSLMLCVGFYEPQALADEVDTLAASFGSRLELGLGAGWLRQDYTRAGLTMPPPAERLQRLRSTVKRLTPGRYRLVLGGGGRRMLTLAADCADVVNISATMSVDRVEAPLGATATFDAFVSRADLIARQISARLVRPEVQCLAFECRVTSDAYAHAVRLAEGYGIQPQEVLRSPLSLIGTADEIRRKIERFRESLGITYWVVKARAMHEFAPIVASLAGR